MKYVHQFSLLPQKFQVASGGVQFSVQPDVPIALNQSVTTVVTDSQDVPFELAQRTCGPQWRYAWIGCVPLDDVLKRLGHTCAGSLTIVQQDAPAAPTIPSDLAFLVALEQAMTRYGTAMPVELCALLGSFITAEKDRHNIQA